MLQPQVRLVIFAWVICVIQQTKLLLNQSFLHDQFIFWVESLATLPAYCVTTNSPTFLQSLIYEQKSSVIMPRLCSSGWHAPSLSPWISATAQVHATCLQAAMWLHRGLDIKVMHQHFQRYISLHILCLFNGPWWNECRFLINKGCHYANAPPSQSKGLGKIFVGMLADVYNLQCLGVLCETIFLG